MREIIRVENLKQHFPIRKGVLKRVVGAVKAVDDVSFSIKKSQMFGLVGESGSGKTTAGRSILKLLEPTDGKVFYKGQEITGLNRTETRKLRKEMQIIFQDPNASLHPRMRIGSIIKRAMIVNKVHDGPEIDDHARKLIARMGLTPQHYNRYPHELSGGQQQRVGIARALAVDPSFIVLDEPTSALDVSVQAQILNLLKELQKDFDLTCLFISHDLSVIDHICDRIAVMYAGKIVEMADRQDLFEKPTHPYTQSLLSAIPEVGKNRGESRIILKGEIPSPSNPPTGCRFHPRCFSRVEGCDSKEPPLKELGADHFVACHLV
ncbi:MAG: ABC transporter ATP-binding protein [Deltaproteobacteria bacterium]|jgi:peptide/nickel transport system ATP-binding protein|nr:ABC transporter ATP-binding protein [Deltaproteobacteria bacterium]MBT4638853.1 ABC transporter ATP-binding protein [Deltaproteobacteria bacterium]MBT6502748.1 ABC transporter ATP-binding protein [Deltaproteobacteria bacterium]MBT6614746.1 ABC transporter ATP-binding protein [Deltaproteobacteria bacterium]MBT7152861.1 ABC transporter ATP-binding protein [Deltaproteobacteria bacterium]